VLLLVGCSSHRFARRNADETANQLATQARAAAHRGDAASAEYFLTAAVKTNPRDCEARLELSEMLEEHGSMAAATDHLRRLIKLNPDDPRGYTRLARVLYSQKEGGEAGKLVDKALELDPENAQAWMLRARLERDQQSDSRALAACYRVLAAAPEDAEARLLAAEIHLKQDNPKQASPLLRSVLDNESDCPRRRAEARWLLGRCYALEGRWHDAAETLSSAICDRQKNATDWYQVAYAHYRSGALAEARQSIDAALEIAPANAEALSLSRLLKARALKTATAEDGRPRSDDAISQVSATRAVPSDVFLRTP
jgi:tetratricopeptide (TPR) repeat protein